MTDRWNHVACNGHVTDDVDVWYTPRDDENHRCHCNKDRDIVHKSPCASRDYITTKHPETTTYNRSGQLQIDGIRPIQVTTPTSTNSKAMAQRNVTTRQRKTASRQRNTTPEIRDSSPGTPQQRNSKTALSKNTSPEQRNATPLQRNTSPQPRNVIPRRRNTSPQSRNAAPLQRNTSPQSRNAAPLQRNTSPQSRNVPPLQRNTSPQSRNAAPLQMNTSQQSRNKTPFSRTTTPLQYTDTTLINRTPVTAKRSTTLQEEDNLGAPMKGSRCTSSAMGRDCPYQPLDAVRKQTLSTWARTYAKPRSLYDFAACTTGSDKQDEVEAPCLSRLSSDQDVIPYQTRGSSEDKTSQLSRVTTNDTIQCGRCGWAQREDTSKQITNCSFLPMLREWMDYASDDEREQAYDMFRSVVEGREVKGEDTLCTPCIRGMPQYTRNSRFPSRSPSGARYDYLDSEDNSASARWLWPRKYHTVLPQTGWGMLPLPDSCPRNNTSQSPVFNNAPPMLRRHYVIHPDFVSERRRPITRLCGGRYPDCYDTDTD